MSSERAPTKTHRHRVPASHCPACRVEMTGASGHDVKPVPLDIAVCVECHAVSVYGDDLMLREPTATEREELAADVEVQRAIRHLENMKRRT